MTADDVIVTVAPVNVEESPSSIVMPESTRPASARSVYDNSSPMMEGRRISEICIMLEPLIVGLKSRGLCFATLRQHPQLGAAARKPRPVSSAPSAAGALVGAVPAGGAGGGDRRGVRSRRAVV